MFTSLRFRSVQFENLMNKVGENGMCTQNTKNREFLLKYGFRVSTVECLRNEKKKISVDFSMDFLESEEIIFNPWIEYAWIAVYFIDPWIKFGYK